MFSQNNHALPPGFELEGYRIERQLSVGGFSIVYLGHDTEGQAVAIKEYLPNSHVLRGEGQIAPTIPVGFQTEFNHGLKLFFEEGRALTGLDHRNVVRVLNFFRANGTVYLVMRYEVGQTLRDFLRKHRGHQDESFLRGMFSGVLDGLGEVHGSGLLHLDIKPANIWLRADNSPVLLDFGAARYAMDIGPPEPRAMYTPGYAAPEQYHGKFTLGPWTDIYAVGACMYAALAGSAPQAADERLQDDQLLPARQRWGKNYSPRLLATIDDCLRLEPMRRPQHARALQASLNTGKAGDQPPGSWLSRLGLRGW
ncbi:MAG: serine/threonine protein kinase [Burkholderiaceae bacterium]|nr:serine/threonine protein kinase [Sulfuritalea sp.]MCF8175314.1 serine/threonine protein kinase [Burkholderiaceae bacterium]